MKRYKKVLILLGVSVILCIATFIVVHTEEKKENIRNTDTEILSVASGSVTSLAWEYENSSLAFTKTDAWHWDEDEAFPVDEGKIDDLLKLFESFGATFIIEDVEDLGQYGLDKPVCTIHIATEQESYEVKLGAFSELDAQRYVSVGDGKVYLVKTDPFDTYEIGLSDLIHHDETPSFDQVTTLRFDGAENYSVSYEENSPATYCAADRYFTQMSGKSVPLDTYRVENLYADISLLTLKDYVSYNVTPEELAAWGLDEPAQSIMIEYRSDDDENTVYTFTIHFGQNQEELAIKAADEANGEEYEQAITSYARIGDSPIVYQISESEYSTLTAVAYNDLRHREVLTADFDDITGIDIMLDEKKHTVTYTVPQESEEEDETDRVYTFDNKEISITNLQSRMTALSVSSFVNDEPNNREEISLIFHLDNESFPQVKLELYRLDGTSCLAVIDGETLGLVSRSSVVDLIEAVNSIALSR